MGKPGLPKFKGEWLQPLDKLTESELGSMSNWFRHHLRKMDRANKVEASKVWLMVKKEIKRRRKDRERLKRQLKPSRACLPDGRSTWPDTSADEAPCAEPPPAARPPCR